MTYTCSLCDGICGQVWRALTRLERINRTLPNGVNVHIRASIRTNMVKFSLILPIILSSLYISFSLAQDSLSSCATNCSQTIGATAGCSSCVPYSIRIMPRLCLTRSPIVAEVHLINRRVSVPTPGSSELRLAASGWPVLPMKL